MIPTRPGRYHFHHVTQGWSVRWVGMKAGELSVIWEDGWNPSTPYGAAQSVALFTQLMTEMGWGEWGERVGDLPPIPQPPAPPPAEPPTGYYAEWLERCKQPRPFDLSTK